MKIKEDLLHYIWSLLTTQKQVLVTADGQQIEIINGGVSNAFEGPDFKEAKLKIGDQIWAGSVEVHINSSDWDKHKHSGDANYNNVILHVVYTHDRDIKLEDGSIIPVLALDNIISEEQLKVYQSLKYNSLTIPCQDLLYKVEPVYLSLMLNKAAVDRLKEKSEKLIEHVESLKGDWNTAFYLQLAENFGFKTNAKPMHEMAQSIPIQMLAKHKDNLHEILALLFGQGGFLFGRMADEYSRGLQETYRFLSNKYELKPIQNPTWKFVKTRPANYPGIRIAQFANLIFNSTHLFSQVIEMQDMAAIIAKFNAEADEYWRVNYHFGKERKKQISAAMGTSSKNLILINTVSVCLFAYGQFTDNENLKEKGLKLLQSLPSENNRIIKMFRSLGFSVNNSMESQGCLGLNRYYCKEKNCLDCLIGKQMLK